MHNVSRLALNILCGLLWVGSAVAADPAEKKKLTAEERAKAEKTVLTYLEEMKASHGYLQPLRDEAVERLFPRHAFFTLLFRQYPAPRVPPMGFVAPNVLVVNPEGKMTVFTAVNKEFSEYLNANMPMSKTDDHAKDVGRSFVRLIQEFSQDGFYKFVLADSSTKVIADGAGKKVTALAVASAGGNGEVSAALMLDENGKMAKIDFKAMLKAGPRPICHATKLLDVDPLVRRIVEQDLLIMGTAVKPYLDEQRTKASPELQQAIDRIWQRILDAEK